MRIAAIGSPDLSRGRMTGARIAKARWIEAVGRAEGVQHLDCFLPSIVEPQVFGVDARTTLPIEYLPGAIRDGRYDIVHNCLSSTRFDKVMAMCDADGLDAPVASCVHYALSYSDVIDSGVQLLLSGVGLRNRIVCPTKAARAAYLELLSSTRERLSAAGVVSELPRASSFVVIPFGVDQHAFAPGSKSVARRRLRLPRSAVVGLHVARLTPFDKADWELMVWIVARVRKRCPDFMAVVAGADALGFETTLRNLARRGGVADGLRLLPNIGHDALRLLYQASDMFFLCGDGVQETQGLVVLEAMASGLPIVAPDWDGYRDMITPECGTLVDTAMYGGTAPFDIDGQLGDGSSMNVGLRQMVWIDREAFAAALVELALSPERRRAQGGAARSRVLAEFTEDQMVARYLEMWRAAASERGTADGRRLRAWPEMARCFAVAYPTRALYDDAQVVASGDASVASAQGIRHIYNDTFARQLLQRLSGPHSIGELVSLYQADHSAAMVRVHVLALLKAGAIRLHS